ncbi:MAG: hypothetical protein R3C05_09270 [Pirellulaceae bacterium]
MIQPPRSYDAKRAIEETERLLKASNVRLKGTVPSGSEYNQAWFLQRRNDAAGKNILEAFDKRMMPYLYAELL